MTYPLHTSACAKLILVGEHAVVYGCPAIAVPLPDLRATVEITSAATLTIAAPDLGQRWTVEAHPDHPLSALVLATAAKLEVALPPVEFIIRSPIPQASGMGSGAAVGTALVRAVVAAVGQTLDPATVSALVYASEQRFHGTPSGIDNTVIAYERPVWFVRSATKADSPSNIETLRIGAPLHLVIADTGVRSETRLPVGAVRTAHAADPARYTALFAEIAVLAGHARQALERGDAAALGALVSQNHALLQAIGVSLPELDQLVAAAQHAGALGAKLSGAGWGGVMLALVPETHAVLIAQALLNAGAVATYHVTLR